MNFILYAAAGVCLLISGVCAAKSGRFVKTLALNAAAGLAALTLLCVFGGYIGVDMSPNPAVVALSAAGGVPGAAFAAGVKMLL